jgi:hypothetical protein
VVVRYPVSSKQYLRYKLKTIYISGAPYNPTGDTLQFAFPASGNPTTYYTAIWETDASTSPTTYIGGCLIGPGGTIALGVGTYNVFMRITTAGGPEIPVIPAGTLEIY